MFRTQLSGLAAAAALLAAPALAQDVGATQSAARPGMSAEATGQPAASEVGANTRAILAIQREGTQAGALVPMTGEQAALGYERYLDSFRFALPEFYTGQANASTVRSGSAGQPIGR
ncbi:DUF3613 domain-containing protein [Cupriavidus pinatubonensis]|nr:DUF3613 domain-containing protein [Cupriavidus pinatubonensis]QYY27626.1 DUF3613 domain-containing protein [Cupriavidus pinatubonensis]TPQ37804.1 DUF3613 domain-containing protein [Cupriavidus pinatubonensis]